MRYWIYLNGEVPGSYAAHELGSVPGFSQTTLVCPAEGEIQEKNWRRAGEFADLASAIDRRSAATAPPAPVELSSSSDISALLDSTGARLIGHVSQLMKQLEESREQQALIQGLQQQTAALTMELKQARDKATSLEEKARGAERLHAQALKDAERLNELETAQLRHEQQVAQLRERLEVLEGALAAARRERQRVDDERAEQQRLADRLGRELADNEASLAKALAVVRRLEETLLPSEPSSLIVPVAPTAPPPPVPELPSIPLPEAAPPAPPAAERAAAEAETPVDALIPPLPPSPPPEPELPPAATEAPAAHHALVQAFRRLFAKDLHS